jgi:hypothetical protein
MILAGQWLRWRFDCCMQFNFSTARCDLCQLKNLRAASTGKLRGPGLHVFLRQCALAFASVLDKTYIIYNVIRHEYKTNFANR